MAPAAARSLLPVAALCFLAGGIAAFIALSPVYVCTLVVLIAAGAMAFLRPGISLLLLLPFLFLSGFFHTRAALSPPDNPAHIYTLIQNPTRLTLYGTVSKMVVRNNDRYRFEMKLHGMIRRNEPGQGEPEPVIGRVRLSLPGPVRPDLSPGDLIMTVADVSRIHNFLTPGSFDYVLTMHNRELYVSGWIPSPGHLHKLPREPNRAWHSLLLLPEQTRSRIGHFLEDHLEPETAGLYQALLIGERGGLTPAIREQFIRTGCMHLLAISGLHIGLLALMLYGLLNLLLRRSQWMLLHTHVPTLALTLSFPVLFLYGFIAGMNTPVMRALIMAGLVLFAVLIHRQTSLIHLVAAAALLVTAWKPLSLFTPSFQLSFAAMTAIALLFPRLRHPIPTGKPNSHILTRLPYLAWASFLLSLTATLGTLPLLLYYFNRFSPAGPVMNLVIEPLLCFIALPLGLIGSLLVPWAPECALYLFKTGAAALAGADLITRTASRLDWVSLWTVTPTIGEILLYYLLLSAVLYHPRPLKIYLSAGLFILLLIQFQTDFLRPETHNARVTFLDVGKGAATLLEFPDGSTILIDGGGSFSSRFNVGRNIIAPYLWKRRIRKLQAVVVTHPDSDHYNGLPFVVQRFRPPVLWINNSTSHSNRYNNLLALGQHSGTIQTTARGMILHRDSLCTLTCLGMPGIELSKKEQSDNNQSLVLRLQCGDHSFLFPGDIEKAAENRLVDTSIPLDSDVLLAPHHGSRTSSGRRFLNKVTPKLIVVSAGRNGLSRFPTRHNQQIWEEIGADTLITGVDGTVLCRTDGKSLFITTLGKERK